MKSALFLFISKSAFAVTIFTDFMQIMYPHIHVITAEDIHEARTKIQYVNSYRIVTITDDEDCGGRLNRSRKTYVIDHEHIVLDLNTIVRMELKRGGDDDNRKVRVILK